MAEERLTDYSEDGVDLTLIRWFLSLTPRQRLEYMENRIKTILAIRELNGVPTHYDRRPVSDAAIAQRESD